MSPELLTSTFRSHGSDWASRETNPNRRLRAVDHLMDLVRDHAVRFPMNLCGGCRVRCVDEAIDLACLSADPVLVKLHSILVLHPEIGRVGGGEGLVRGHLTRNVVTVHEQ